MLESAWFLARKDVSFMLRSRETLLWIFVMPVIFFFFIGSVTGGFAGGSGPTTLVVENSALSGFLADHFMTRLEQTGFRIVLSDTMSAPSKATRLTIPAAFTDSVLAGHRVDVLVTRESSGLRADYDRVRVQRAVITVLADLLVGFERGEAPTPESLKRVAALPRTVELRVEQAGKRRKIPTGFEQAIPGTMIMFTWMLMLTSGAILLVIERRQGLLRRLASSPLSRTSVVLGKWGGRILLGGIQIGFAMAVGALLFKMRWGANLPMLLVVLLFYAMLTALIGIVLGNLARTEGQAVGIAIVSANVFAALGGCWWPIEITPEWMQKLALFIPTGWAMDAMHKLVSFQDPPSTVLPHVLGMAFASLAVGWIAARTFRFQ